MKEKVAEQAPVAEEPVAQIFREPIDEQQVYKSLISEIHFSESFIFFI